MLDLRIFPLWPPLVNVDISTALPTKFLVRKLLRPCRGPCHDKKTKNQSGTELYAEGASASAPALIDAPCCSATGMLPLSFQVVTHLFQW